MKQIAYASIIPLIGGESLGVQNKLNGQLPEYVLSYSPFANNDRHYVEYIRGKGWKGDYVFLDTTPDYKASSVDVINSTCPCAGLSSYSTTSSADSAVNEWLYTTAEYVLGTVGPKVFWGENAPRLFTAKGKPVADKLFEIGQKYGYSLNLYATESRLHGLAQIRPRTFYFFTKGDTAPIFNWFLKEQKPIEDILKRDIDPNDSMNVLINSKDPLDDGWVRYAMYKTGTSTLKELYDTFEKTQNLLTYADTKLGENLNDVAKWFDENDLPNYARITKKNQAKLDIGKGYWAHGTTIPKGQTGAFIGGQPFFMINPFKNSYLTLRDALRIMGLPDDFQLHGENPLGSTNHICQNVPVSTAEDMMECVTDFLEGKTEMSNAPYIKQNNKSRKIEKIGAPVQTLDNFFK